MIYTVTLITLNFNGNQIKSEMFNIRKILPDNLARAEDPRGRGQNFLQVARRLQEGGHRLRPVDRLREGLHNVQLGRQG